MATHKNARKKDLDSSYLEVQDGINIHYRVYKAINTFRKPSNKKSGSTLSQVRRTASGIKEVERSHFRDDLGLIRSSAGAHVDGDDIAELDVQDDDAELEQEIPDGLEELPHHCTSTPTMPAKEIETPPKNIIFVLLHSFLGCTVSWDAVVNPLRQYGTVISFDRPGFGRSSKPLPQDEEIWSRCSLDRLASCSMEGCTQNDYEESDSEGGLRGSNPAWVNPYSDLYSAHIIMRLLHHILDHDTDNTNNKKRNRTRKLQKRKARGERRSIILVGHSLGARCALNAFYYFPQSFSGLIMVNPSLFTDAASVPGFAPNLVRQVGISFLRLLPGLVPPRIAYYDYDSCIDEEKRLNYQQIFHDPRWQQSLQTWSKFHFSEPSLSPERVLLRVNIPVLVTAGDHDSVVSSSDCRKILTILESGKQPPALFAEFQQTGHCPMEEKPALFVTVLEAFLEKYIKSISYEKGIFTGSSSSVIAAYRNQHQDPFREGCIVLDNITGEFSLLCAPTISNLSKSTSFAKDLDEIIPS